MGVVCDDMFERHPAGMELAAQQLHRQYRLPIYLTEHGSASTDEAFRERDLKENLAALHRVIGRAPMSAASSIGRCWTTSNGSSATRKSSAWSPWTLRMKRCHAR